MVAKLTGHVAIRKHTPQSGCQRVGGVEKNGDNQEVGPQHGADRGVCLRCRRRIAGVLGARG